MNNLGLLYSKGQGVAQDHIKAREWFQKADDAGIADAVKTVRIDRLVSPLFCVNWPISGCYGWQCPFRSQSFPEVLRGQFEWRGFGINCGIRACSAANRKRRSFCNVKKCIWMQRISSCRHCRLRLFASDFLDSAVQPIVGLITANILVARYYAHYSEYTYYYRQYCSPALLLTSRRLLASLVAQLS
jgi:hypothetical protein